MRLLFAGTPEFAARPLAALIRAGLAPVAVYTQPDRPAGRGRKLTASPVKALALQHDIAVVQPPSLRDPDSIQALGRWQADLMIVIAYGLILPPAVLALPRLGCVNLHASLLPRWRGAAPIQRAIEAGDSETGLCLMQMEAGLDTGPVLAQATLPIAPQMVAGVLHDALAALAEDCLPGWIRACMAGELSARQQDDSQACYAHKLKRADALLDWSAPAAQLARSVRAFNPWPGAHSTLAGEAVRILAAQADTSPAEPPGPPGQIGAIEAERLPVACGQGRLLVEELQWAGGRPMSAAAAARGRSLTGARFGH